jgi:hypothetical protein
MHDALCLQDVHVGELAAKLTKHAAISCCCPTATLAAGSCDATADAAHHVLRNAAAAACMSHVLRNAAAAACMSHVLRNAAAAACIFLTSPTLYGR